MREFLTAGVGIVALVFSVLGIVFTTTGLCLTVITGPQTLGILFLCFGGGILAVGVALLAIRLAAIRRRAWLLECGLETSGAIVEVAQNPRVRVHGRRPWVVRYRYEVLGCVYFGRDTMMELPVGYEPGAGVVVKYDQGRPEVSVLLRG